jgi:hypothetical protein
MNPKIIITCAVTGAGDTVGKSPNVPVTPEQIANSALEAAATESRRRCRGRGIWLHGRGQRSVLDQFLEGHVRFILGRNRSRVVATCADRRTQHEYTEPSNVPKLESLQLDKSHMARSPLTDGQHLEARGAAREQIRFGFRCLEPEQVAR